MSSSSSDAEELPPAPFLRPPARQAHVITLSSDSEDELPLLQRLHLPPPGVAAPKKSDPPSRPNQLHPSSRNLSAPPPRAVAPPPRGAVSRDPEKVSLPRRRKKSLDVITVYIDPVLLQDGPGGQVLSALQAQETPCIIQPQPVSRSITWSRATENTNGDTVCQEEAEMIVLVPGEDFVAMIHNSKTDSGPNSVTLSTFVAHIMANKSCAIPTLVVMEVEKYFKNQKTKSRKKLQEAVRGGDAAKDRRQKRRDKEEALQLSRIDVEEALLVLQLHTDVHVWFLETSKEFSDFVSMFSKSMAEAPIKRQRNNSSFSFYLDGEWAAGFKVERCGKGLLEVWKRQIQQFNRVSVEVASAIVAVYPSPQLLVKAYHRCQTLAERHNLLSDILVRRGEGIISTTRRVGPELSKRIYLQLMSSEPELSLDL